ncbi:MAG: hypothetical protein WBL93_07310 [Lutisporaceae bacterium]
MKKLYNIYFNMICSLKNKRGQGMLEYILIIILIGATLVTVLGGFSGALDSKFDTVKDTL